jgi:hypothetical protein
MIQVADAEAGARPSSTLVAFIEAARERDAKVRASDTISASADVPTDVVLY